MPGIKPSPGFSALLRYITPHRRVLSGIAALLLCTSLLSLAHPWLAGSVTASILGEGRAGTGALLGLWLLVMLLRSLLGFASLYTVGRIGERITAEMRARLHQHLQYLPLNYHWQRRSGETLTLLSTDAAIISGFVTETLVQLLPSLLTFGGAFLLMAWLDPTIATIAVLCLPLYFLAIKLLGRKMRPLSRDWIEANSNMISIVEENLSMLPAIKTFTREDFERERFAEANDRLLALSRQQLWIQSTLSPAIGLLAGVGLLVLLWVGTAHVESGRLDAPELVSLLLYALLMMNPLRTLANVYGQVQRCRGSAERIVRFLDTRPEPADDGARTLGKIAGNIRFENVTFAYDDGPAVLQDFNLEIGAGETVALTGPNGAGKTTVAYLLLRLVDPDQGRILLDGVDIREATIASVRQQSGLVAQQVLLLNATVTENIAYANPRAERAAVVAAARAAHAHEFITALPQGYETVIGDQGIRLSGGQRQRISLARTLLADPPILVLDEATAMFDPAGEKAFIEECRELLSTKTVVLITHRPASLALADRVIDLGASFSCARTRQDPAR